MTNEVAAAKLAKVYLRSRNSFTALTLSWDLRPLEYKTQGDSYLKIPHLLRTLEGLHLEADEEKARKVLIERNVQSVNEVNVDFILELIRNC